MPFNQIVLSIIIPIVVGLGGYLIGAIANRRLVKADTSDKVSSSYSKLVDDLQEENKKLRNSTEKLERNYNALKLRQDDCESLYNAKLEELSRKYSRIIEENVALQLRHDELKQEYAEHRQRSKERMESLQRITEARTEAMESEIREYKQTVALQGQRIQILEASVNGGLKT